MLRIAVRTQDDRLYQKLLLILEGTAEVLRTKKSEINGFDIVFLDMRFCDIASTVDYDTGSYVLIGEEGGLSYPFSEGELLEIINEKKRGNKKSRLTPLLDDHCLLIDERTVALTDVEWRLYEMIAEGGGEYVPREKLIRGVWGDGYTESSLNVYIHYLRTKLEQSGERVILSSRRGGYKIDEKFL